MKIIADEQIPYVKEAFSQFGEVITLPGRSIKQFDVIHTDILLTRSVTRVDDTLLKNSSIQFVATATSGINHIDQEYLNQHGIAFHYAAGSNARSVAEYVLSTVLTLSERLNFQLNDKTLGLVGYGHVGSCVANFFASLGVKCLVNDPPLQDQGLQFDFVTLEEVLSADIISLHVPLVEEGEHPTRNLLNTEKIDGLRDGTILINTCRGEVVDEAALLLALKSRRIHAVIDVWQNEPDINLELLKEADIGTAHIAGYSLDAKIRATEMIYQACCEHFHQPKQWCKEKVLPGYVKSSLNFDEEKASSGYIKESVMEIYDGKIDDQLLRASFDSDQPANYFDSLRKAYRIRREFPALQINTSKFKEKESLVLQNLGFSIT